MANTQDPHHTDASATLTIEKALELATAAHRAGHHAYACEIYQRVLALVPDHPDALHFLGILAHQQGRNEDALRLVGQSVDAAPKHVGFRSNLGNLLLDLERFEDAEREYREALVLDPDRPDALHNYAVLCKALGRYPEAERALLRAITLVPDFTRARNALADLYVKLGRIDEGVQQACEALLHEPQNTYCLEMLGYANCRLGRTEEAARIFREWLAAEPNNPTAAHHLAACTGEGIPARASDAYVRCTFDHFANSFDSRLAILEYQAPSLVAAAVADCVGVPGVNLDILDAGCGTGLCAAALKPFARTLVGVDLSGGMLQKAEGRKLYDMLHQFELCAFMQVHPDTYDLIVSADTLVYFGALELVLEAAAGALRPHGHLCFTVEALEDGQAGDYRLQHHGRYAHSQDYMATLLGRRGLAVRRLESVVLRRDAGLPVAGWLVLAQRPQDR